MGLTKEQSIPIETEVSNKIILAGPGTGKSFTILGYINHLIGTKKVDPQTILVITFTRAATNELKQKIRKELGDEAELPRVFTLHGFALRQLMRNSKDIASLPKEFSIANDFEERYLIMEDIKALIKAEKIKEVKRLFNLLSANWETLNIEKGDWEYSFENPAFLGAWQEHRSIYGYLLRSELVYQLKKALDTEKDLNIDAPIEHLIVDEYQDLNKCDLAIIQFLNKNGTKLFCAGDDDQSIYGFRYAYPEGIRNFTKEISESSEFKITECYRCDESILSLALNIISQDPKRIAKRLKSMSGLKGEYHLLRFANQFDESNKIGILIEELVKNKAIPENEIMILLRSDHNSNFSKPIIDALTKKGVKIDDEGNRLNVFDTTSGRYLIALLKYFNNPQNDLALRTILELTTGLGSVTFSSIYEKAKVIKKRFHQVVEGVLSGEITDVKNNAKIKSTIEGINKVKVEIESEKDILVILERLRTLIPDLTAEFSETLEQIVKEQEIRDIEELIEFTNELLGPDKESFDRKAVGVRIMSMHQAKGLTAKVVFIIAAEEEYTPGRGDIDEERRLFYVSVTRAKHYLFITYCNDRIYAQKRSGYLTHDTTKRNLTRYLRDLPTIKPVDGLAFKIE
jgi:DNA helicase II / ATP-dependent DNA helicase PcrA